MSDTWTSKSILSLEQSRGNAGGRVQTDTEACAEAYTKSLGQGAVCSWSRSNLYVCKLSDVAAHLPRGRNDSQWGDYGD